ncbi:hypothetical protein KCU78_g6150, partial [Aureobasidium melanogenum]
MTRNKKTSKKISKKTKTKVKKENAQKPRAFDPVQIVRLQATSDPPLTRAQCEDYISRHGADEAEPVLVVGVGTLRSGLDRLSELQAVTKTTSPFLLSLQISTSRSAQMAKNKNKAQKKVLLDLNKIVEFLKNEPNFQHIKNVAPQTRKKILESAEEPSTIAESDDYVEAFGGKWKSRTTYDAQQKPEKEAEPHDSNAEDELAFANYDSDDDEPDVDGPKPFAPKPSSPKSPKTAAAEKAAESRKVLGLLEKKHASQAGRRAVNRNAQGDTEVRSQSFADLLASRRKPSVNTGGINVVSAPLSAANTWTTKDEIARGQLVKQIESRQKLLAGMDARKRQFANSAFYQAPLCQAST